MPHIQRPQALTHTTTHTTVTISAGRRPLRNAYGVIVALLSCLSLIAFAPSASAATAEKVTICHATGSQTNPYVQITISQAAAAALTGHPESGDVIPAPAAGCDSDLCPNISGVQLIMPDGLVIDASTGNCVPPPADLCPNIPGDQNPVPTGMTINLDGDCVAVNANTGCVVSAGVQQFPFGDGTFPVYGTDGDDTIDCSQTNEPVVVYGEGGNDSIAGTPYSDVIYGYAGNDTLYGGAGTDYLFGGLGDDAVRGGAGNDFLFGDPGQDELYGEQGDDYLSGTENDASVDSLFGGADTDTCTGPGLDEDVLSDCET